MTPPRPGGPEGAAAAGGPAASARSGRSGLFARLHRLLGTTLEIVQLRVELLATDVQLGALRFLDALALALAALLLLAAGLGLLAAWIVLMMAPEYRLTALGVIAIVLLAAGAWALAGARARLRSAGGAFAATRGELARDLTALGRDGSGPA
jgi:uncharacterized membrane protein YqjE